MRTSTIQIIRAFFLGALLCTSQYGFSQSIEQAKTKCISLGFKSGTEDFGKCVLKLSNESGDNAELNTIQHTNTLSIVVPFTAQGGAAYKSKFLVQPLSNILNKNVEFIYKPGQLGIPAMEYVVNAKPDGSTLGVFTISNMAVNKYAINEPKNDPEKYLIPIALLDKTPIVLAVSKSSQYKSLNEVINSAKTYPGTLSFTSIGILSTGHLVGELIKQSTGANFTFLLNNAAPLNLNTAFDLVNSGKVTMLIEGLSAGLRERIQSGELIPLAITSNKRSPLLPSVPTFIELGYPNIEAYYWYVFAASKLTSKTVASNLNIAINKALQDPTAVAGITSNGSEISLDSIESLNKFISLENKKWSEVIKKANIKMEN